MQNLLVAFQSTDQRIESLALALGLGAVQHGANIRLRHLSPPEQSSLAHQGYGRLKTADIEWAECLAIGIESKDINADIEDLLIILNEAAERSNLSAKLAYLFGEVSNGGEQSFSAVRICLQLNTGGFKIVESEFQQEHSIHSMTLMGNRLVEL